VRYTLTGNKWFFIMYISHAMKLVANKVICGKSCTFLYTRVCCKAVLYTQVWQKIKHSLISVPSRYSTFTFRDSDLGKCCRRSCKSYYSYPIKWGRSLLLSWEASRSLFLRTRIWLKFALSSDWRVPRCLSRHVSRESIDSNESFVGSSKYSAGSPLYGASCSADSREAWLTSNTHERACHVVT